MRESIALVKHVLKTLIKVSPTFLQLPPEFIWPTTIPTLRMVSPAPGFDYSQTPQITQGEVKAVYPAMSNDKIKALFARVTQLNETHELLSVTSAGVKLRKIAP